MNSSIHGAAPSYDHGTLLFALLFAGSATLALFSVGCATVGRDFPVSKVPEIRIGKTTQDEIRVLFGSPWRVGIEDGQRTWTYGKYRYVMFGQREAQDLVVRFDDNGIVVSYAFSTTKHEQ